MNNIRKCVLTKTFFLKATEKNYYLSNISDERFISEPYQVSKNQYKLLTRLDGSLTLKQICDLYPRNVQTNIKKFIKKLERIGAVVYKDKPILRYFLTPTKEPHLMGVHLELTKQCNLSCLHCYQSKFNKKAGKPLTAKEIEKLALEMEKMNVINVSVSGGEPFVDKNLFTILRIFENHGIKVGNIFSNGILINKKIISNLKKLKSNPHLIVSLDGPDSDIHGLIRGITKKDRDVLFGKLIKNIKLLNKNKIVVKINTTIYRENLNKLIDLSQLLMSLKIKMWRLAIPKYAGAYIENQKAISIDFKELKDKYLELIKHYLGYVKKEKQKIVVPFDLRISNTFKTEMLSRPIVRYTLDSSTCEYTRNRISVKHNGDVASCSMLSDFIPGNIRVKSLKDIWHSDEMQKMKNLSIGEVEDCGDCEYYSVCGSGCRVNSLYKYKSLYRKDNETCECFKFFKDVIRLVQKQGFEIKFLNKSEKSEKKYKSIQIRGTKLYL